MKPFALIVALGLAALAGCGSEGGRDSASPPAGPAELTADAAAEGGYEGPAVVTGNVLFLDDEMRICEALAESFPPQCGGGSVLVEGIEPALVPWMVEVEGVWWTDRPVELEGVLADGVLTVRQNVGE
ncbi:MAG TPA: hypothetical protein VK915_08835 [Gaiellaceae bacterium]|nr:hypothetical protein [Gaiellaceae bacterium]